MGDGTSGFDEYVRLATRIYQRAREGPENSVDTDPEQLEPVTNTRLAAIIIQGFGSSSNPDSRDHYHVRAISELLSRRGIPYCLFSYRGIQDRNYGPRDTRVNFASKSEELTDFLSLFPDGRVLIFGHSQGGNLAANWVCNIASDSEIERVAGMVFIASPLLLAMPYAIGGSDLGQNEALVLSVLEGYAIDRATLAERLKRQFIIVRCWQDGLAPPEFSTFFTQPRPRAPLSEIAIRDASHKDICGHYLTLAAINAYIDLWERDSPN